MGVEPTTFKLEVQRADPLRHEGTAQANDSVANELFYRKILLHPKINELFCAL